MRNLSLIINFLLILIVLPFSYLRAEVDSLNIKYRVVGSIPFSPVEGDAIDVSLLNNEVSGELPIGFPFRFFENTYTGFYISSNGFITFSADNYHGCCSGQLLPEPSSPNNLIAFDWEYLLPENGGTINYFTTGSAPNRKLVVNFNNVPTYSSGNPVTTQIVLFEGTNIIEVHTTQLTNDGWERTMGLENSDGTIAYTVPERNSTNWTASEEGVRFEPYFQKDDAGLQAINSPQPYICTNGSFPIEVTVQNFGTNILESVNVNWELNGVLQQPLLVQTPLYPRITGDSSVLKVTLGSLAFSLGQEFSVKAWTSLPNGVMDSVNNNDTLSVLAKGALGGNFTIGGSNPDFATFADAVTSLITYGICQPVVFNIRSGIYNEQVSIPEIPGATGINTITFQSETGNAADVQLIYSADYDDNYILQLNNAGNIIVKNITLEATNETYGRVIDIRNSPYTNSFIGNRIIGIGLATSDYQASVIYLSDDNSGGGEFKGKGLRGLNNTSLYALDAEHNTSFLNNYIKGGSYGVYLYAYGSEEDYNIKGVVFENNQFDEQYYTGLYLSGRINIKVIGNSIESTNSSSWLYGINCSYLQSPFEIGRNKISLVNGTGIYFYGSYSPEQSNGIVANNFISLGGDNNNYGINLSYSSRISFYHNNIHIYSSASNAIPFYTYGCEQLKLYNNIFANSGQGYAIQVNSGDVSESDYNSFYTKGTSLGYWSGNILKGITEWRNTTSLDMHSYFTDPLYVSSTDLHVNKALLNGTGLSLPEIIIDIDGQSRQNPPDIGADEFVPVNENVELIDLDYPHLPFAPGSYPIKAVIKNSGASVLVSLDISWQINGDAKPDLHWTGSLPTGQSDTVELGTFTFVYKSSYSIKAWTSKPNNSDDIEPINDTIATDTFYPALSGTYTIGGNSPDFTTFAEVSDILNKGGVSGFATFNIRNGTYTEQFTLGRFPGSSCTNTVTFQPESGDSTAVIIQHNSEYNNNYILKLNGAIGVVIRKLTFRPQNQYYGHAIEMTNGSSCNLISNNIFNGIATTSSSDIGAIIYSPYGDNELHNDNKNIFTNNKFRFGSSGITFIGYGSTRETGTLIKRNLFENQAYNGIFLQYQNAPRIEENIISTSTNNTSFFGIYASSCYDSSVIEKNKIAITHGGYGVYVESNTGRSGAEALIANNFISIGGNSTAYGIYTYYGSYQKIYHNNINITSLNVSGSAFYSYNCGNLQILNNILTNSAAGFAINFYNLYNSVSDYNNLYSKGIYLGYTSVNISDIASWRTALNQDHNSISTNPLFYSATDLHVNKALLNGRGVAVSEVTTDIDGEPRDQVPDIGADEFTPSGSNVQFVSLSTPTAPFAPGTYPVSAIIKNAGSDTLTSVSVLWQVNGVSQPTYSWTGALVTGAEDSVLLGNIPFTLGSGSNIKAWVAEPNGGTDIDPDDDTIRINNIYASLSGTYTIGGTSPDFTTFDAAIKALNYGGVRAPVTFNIRNGTYTEQLSLQNFPGTKCDIPVTFQAESGDSTAVILQYNANASNNYTLQLNGTQGVTIKKLTIKSLNASYGRVISIMNGAQCNKFLGNVLQGTNTGSTSDYNAIVYSPTGNSALQNDSKNIFSNNWFRNGSFGIFFNGYSSPLETGTVIEDNFFENQFYMGVWLQYQQATAINRNRIITNSTYSSFFGIYANSCYNTSSFQNNKINIANGGYGIYLYSTYGTSGSEALIANNFISIGGTSTAIGISTYYGSYLKAYHNSVNITSSNSSGRAYYSYNSSYVQLYNNIFANSGSGYGIYIDYNNYGNAYNYNNIYSKGPYLAYLNGNLADIAAWRAASNQDNNSVSTNPLFLSFSDLHVNKAVLNGRGISVAEVTTDIDGETRSNPPDIGADEFTAEGSNVHLIALNLPKAPFAPGLYPVSAIIKNVGADTLTSVDISWEVNGVQQPAYNWTGSLLTEGEDSVLLGSFAFNNVSASNVKAWVSNPNGSTDVDPSDDTLRVGNLYASLSGTFTIGGSPADFPTFNAAVNALNYGGITGPVTFNIRNGIYSEQVTLKRFPGSSCEVPVTFQSENGDNTVTLQYNAASNANYTILFDGASGITIKEIIIKSLNTSYGRVVEFAAGASCNKIIGSVLQGASSTSSSTSHAVVLSSSGNNLNENCNNNVFSNNRILSGSYGFYYLGYSSSIGYLETGTVIHGNVFQGQYYKGIFLQSQLAPQITENTLSTTSTRTDFFGVHFVYCYDNLDFKK